MCVGRWQLRVDLRGRVGEAWGGNHGGAKHGGSAPESSGEERGQAEEEELHEGKEPVVFGKREWHFEDVYIEENSVFDLLDAAVN